MYDTKNYDTTTRRRTLACMASRSFSIPARRLWRAITPARSLPSSSVDSTTFIFSVIHVCYRELSSYLLEISNDPHTLLIRILIGSSLLTQSKFCDLVFIIAHFMSPHHHYHHIKRHTGGDLTMLSACSQRINLFYLYTELKWKWN